VVHQVTRLNKFKLCDDFNPPVGCHNVTNTTGTPLPQDVGWHHPNHCMMGLTLTYDLES
jgi:hypothetical protein